MEFIWHSQDRVPGSSTQSGVDTQSIAEIWLHFLFAVKATEFDSLLQTAVTHLKMTDPSDNFCEAKPSLTIICAKIWEDKNICEDWIQLNKILFK